MSGPNATVWQPGNQEGEYAAGTSNPLVDSTAVALVDSSGVALADNGTTYTPVSQTVWSQNDTA